MKKLRAEIEGLEKVLSGSITLTFEEFDRVLKEIEGPHEPTEELSALMQSKAPWEFRWLTDGKQDPAKAGI